MSHPGNALQKGIYDRLTGYAALTTALGGARIFDFIPQGQTPPYVRIGDETRSEWDTKTEHGWDATMTIHAWSFEAAGQKEIKTILGLLYDALHQQEDNITVAGFQLVTIVCEFDHSYLEPSVEGAPDKYWHGVMRFRALLSA